MRLVRAFASQSDPVAFGVEDRMGVPVERQSVEADEVREFLKAGHHRLAFAVVCVKTIRLPLAIGVSGYPAFEMLKSMIQLFG